MTPGQRIVYFRNHGARVWHRESPTHLGPVTKAICGMYARNATVDVRLRAEPPSPPCYRCAIKDFAAAAADGTL